MWVIKHLIRAQRGCGISNLEGIYLLPMQHYLSWFWFKHGVDLEASRDSFLSELLCI